MPIPKGIAISPVLSKALEHCILDRYSEMSHHGLFTKLMEKYIPVNLLSLLERWFALSETCVKWDQVVSSFVNLLCGVRQGGVLSRTSLLSLSTVSLTRLNQAVWAAMLNGHV